MAFKTHQYTMDYGNIIPAALTCTSSPPTRTLVVDRSLLLSFLLNFPFIISPSISHVPWDWSTSWFYWDWQGFLHRCDTWSPNLRPSFSSDPNWTHRDFGSVGQAVVKLDAQREVDLFGAEGARLLDVEFVAVLLDGDLQVVVFSQLSLHGVNPCMGKQEVNDKS